MFGQSVSKSKRDFKGRDGTVKQGQTGREFPLFLHSAFPVSVSSWLAALLGLIIIGICLMLVSGIKFPHFPYIFFLFVFSGVAGYRQLSTSFARTDPTGA